MSGPEAFIRPDVLEWARESVGYELSDAAHGIGMSESKLRLAERGEARLTLHQAEQAARLFERPLAALFLSSPPAEEPQESQFRRLPGAPEPPWPPAMAKLAIRVRRRQRASVDLLELLGEEAEWVRAKSAFSELPMSRAATGARRLLGIGIDEQFSWRDRDGYTPLRMWIDALEAQGILVMHDGTLKLEQMRGFTSLDPDVPIVVVNTNDDARARVFTLIYELGHLYLDLTGPRRHDEEWLEEFAGKVLMPPGDLAKVADDLGGMTELRQIDQAALLFGVTPRALLTRAARDDLIAEDAAKRLFEGIRRRAGRARESKVSGGNYYRNQLGRLGPAFSRLVFNALENQAVTYAAASDLLGIKVNHFEKFRSYLDERAAPA